jgi:glycosyltransferase involved in cell wall biosynthesis
MAEKKNLHVLVPMMANLEYDLVIAGLESDTNYKQKLKDLTVLHKVENRVHFVGEISEQEKYWYLNNCDGFVFPSISEGFGIPPVEAMRLGKPVFLSKATSLPEVGGDIAYYFEDFESQSMSDVVFNGIEDFQNKNRKQESIDWSNQFTWMKSAELYKEVYKEVLEM